MEFYQDFLNQIKKAFRPAQKKHPVTDLWIKVVASAMEGPPAFSMRKEFLNYQRNRL